MREKIALTAIMLLISFAMIGSKSQALSHKSKDDDVIPNGIFIDEIDMSGKTEKEAKDSLKEFVGNLRSEQINFKIDGEEIAFSFEDFSYRAKKHKYIKEALGIGKTGNLIKRYKDLKDIEVNNIVYPLEFEYDQSLLDELVKERTNKFNIPAKNAGIIRENGHFSYTNHESGRKVLVDEMSQEIKGLLEDWNRSSISLEVVVEEEHPKYTRDIAERCKVVLGSFETYYASSGESRSENLANGARLINNAVIYPGEVFSAYEYLTPFTESNGYYSAGAYASGKVIDSIGGGACQVTTTLYNAILESELEVVERAAHSMTIGYAELSRDAAIAGTYKDLKFRNDTEVPILIEAETVGKKIRFTIWGEETRSDNRTIKYETEVLSKVDPPEDVITVDKDLPASYRAVTQSAHVGYTTELYKVTYENGVEVSRERVNRSSYAATPNYITVGGKEVEPEEVDDNKKPADDTKPVDDKKPVDNKKPVDDKKPVDKKKPIDDKKPPKTEKKDKPDKGESNKTEEDLD